MVVDRETVPLPAERKCADPGACKVVASNQLEAEVAAINPNAAESDENERGALAVALVLSDSGVSEGGWGRWRERIVRSRHCRHSSRPALACIIGARRAWTVEMISSEEIPWR